MQCRISSNRFALSPLADISELNLPKSCIISFPNGKDDLMNFEVSIRPDEGYYLYGIFLTLVSGICSNKCICFETITMHFKGICLRVEFYMWLVFNTESNNNWAVFSSICGYRGGNFLFSFQVSPIYPHEAPKVKCKTKVDLLIPSILFLSFSFWFLLMAFH